MNLSKITDWLLVGTTPETGTDLETLSLWSVGKIINCRIEYDDAPFLKAHPEFFFQYLNDGVPDWTPDAAIGKQPLPVSFFAAALKFFPLVPRPAPDSEMLFVHCANGANRSVVLAFALLVASGMSELEAVALLNLKRPIWAQWNDFADHPWREDAEKALRQLGYIH